MTTLPETFQLKMCCSLPSPHVYHTHVMDIGQLVHTFTEVDCGMCGSYVRAEDKKKLGESIKMALDAWDLEQQTKTVMAPVKVFTCGHEERA